VTKPLTATYGCAARSTIPGSVGICFLMTV
jgi:hypothetical protein